MSSKTWFMSACNKYTHLISVPMLTKRSWTPDLIQCLSFPHFMHTTWKLEMRRSEEIRICNCCDNIIYYFSVTVVTICARVDV